jgi:hypothetical protein
MKYVAFPRVIADNLPLTVQPSQYGSSGGSVFADFLRNRTGVKEATPMQRAHYRSDLIRNGRRSRTSVVFIFRGVFHDRADINETLSCYYLFTF